MPSATVMQGYMRAAAHVSRVAVGDPSIDASSTQYAVPRTQSQKDRVDGAPFGTRGGTVVTHNFPADGNYDVPVAAPRRADRVPVRPHGREIQMEVAVDGERVAVLKVDRWMSESDPEGLTVSTGPINVRAGARRVAATFIQEFEGSGRRSDQANRSHAGRHADWRGLRGDDAAAPAQPGHRRPVRGDRPLRPRRRGVRSSSAGRPRPAKRRPARGASSIGSPTRPIAGRRRPPT